MISFLLEEGVLTVGTLSGLFTTGLLNSLKNNIIDPSIENLYPSHKLDKAPVKIPVKVKNEENLQNGKSNFADIFPITVGAVPPTNPAEKNIIKWQTFLKDFITWLVIMFCLYIFWKKVLQPLKVQKV